MRIPKILAAVALVAVGTLGLTACTADEPTRQPVSVATDFASGTTMARLHDAGAMTIATRFHQPLFGLVGADKKPAGFDVEIGKLIATKLGIAEAKITWVEATAANRDKLLTDGKADLVIAGYPITDASKKVVSFAGPYYASGQDILVTAKNPEGIKGPVGVKGKKVCTINKSMFATVIAGYGPTLTKKKSAADCLAPLLAGTVAAVTADDVTLAGLAAQNEGKVKVLGAPFTAVPAGIALAHDDEKFRSFVGDVLEQAIANGTWAKLWSKTAGTVLGTARPPMLDRY